MEIFDFLINDEDEVMLLLYQRESTPDHPIIDMDRETRSAVLYRNETDKVELEDIADEIFDSLQDEDKLLVCELTQSNENEESSITYAYEAEINL